MRPEHPIPLHDPKTRFLRTADLLDSAFTPFEFDDLRITEPWFQSQHGLDKQLDVTEIVGDGTTDRRDSLLTLVLLLAMARRESTLFTAPAYGIRP
jgi:hypothetical protein